MIKLIYDYCCFLETRFSLISEERKALLRGISKHISNKIQVRGTPSLIVVCTHNSRRSHIGQLFLAIGADYYNLPQINTGSGGTEATAFNPRSVAALKRVGLDIQSPDVSLSNPKYKVKWKMEMNSYQAFSKKYDDPVNPESGFAAIMVCNEADRECPVIVGCDLRVALPFKDPKAYDDTDLEAVKYDEACQLIGREMLFVMKQVSR